MTFSLYASVMVEGGLPKPLDYGVPKELADQVRAGLRVKIPVRGKLRSGIILELKKRGFPKALPIAELLPQTLPEELLQLAEWISRYYMAPFQTVLRCMVPTSIRKGVAAKKQLTVEIKATKETLRQICAEIQNRSPAQARLLEVLLKARSGIFLTELIEQAETSRSSVDALVTKELIALREVAVDRSPLADQEYFPSKPKSLNEEQQTALDAITLGTFQTHLLYGITGSGKTEVYLQAIQKALDLGKGTIMLVPEIALTPQTVERFRSRFEGDIAVLHHRLSDGERRDEWERIRQGKAPIAIGPRSAIFSPLPNLGLIIVDEEHESSYKQTDTHPHYHARDVAIMRGKLTGSTVILGTATPSLESMFNCQNGKYNLLRLTYRADSANLPTVKIIDGSNLLSDELLTEIEKRYKVGEQSLLFLNRRGYHSMLFCSGCKNPLRCPHCDLSLTHHKGHGRLSCHLCDYTLSPPPKKCPDCGAADPLSFRGAGTEQVERTLNAIFPDIRTMRVDADTTRHKGSHERLLHAFRSGKADVLIGTQMIAKGLHFPQVTLVGVLNSDISLNIPDYRSAERVFQLLTQVAGRAGRGAIPGKVLIQSRMADNSTIQLAARQDYDAFYAQEIEVRQLFNYPPFTHLIKLTCSGENAEETHSTAERLHQVLSQCLPDVLPVTPSGHAKIKDRFRFQFIVRGKSVYTLNTEIQKALPPLPKGIRLSIDVDPLSTYF